MLNRNFVETIKQSLTENWDRPCFSNYGEEIFYYRDVAESILTFHEAFRINGIEPGNKIAVCGRNSVNWAKTYLAAVTYGAVIVPVLPDFSAADITNIINHSEARFFFAADYIWKNLKTEEMPNLELVINLEDFAIIKAGEKYDSEVLLHARTALEKKFPGGLTPESVQFEEISNDKLESIVYTSGTTGFSKGVMLNHNCMIANVDYAQHNIALKAGDKIVSFLPVAHSFGCAFEFLFPFNTGCHITFLHKRVSPQLIMKAFGEISPRLILSVPLVIEKIYFKQLKPILNKPYAKLPLIKQILDRVIYKKLTATFGGNFISIVIGAAAFNPEVEAFLSRIKFRFTVGYGMTECGPLISYMPWDVYKSASAGRIINHLECKIDSEDPQNVLGEICVRGENVMLGYYKNEEATAQSIDKDGWLHTGDMGTLDPDGTVYIKGRCKNMLLGPAGQNIYPEEIEAKLNNSDIIADSLVISRDHRIIAIVYADPDYIESKNLSDADVDKALNDVMKTLNKELPSYSTLVAIERRKEEFQKTPTAKIKRYLYE